MEPEVIVTETYEDFAQRRARSFMQDAPVSVGRIEQAGARDYVENLVRVIALDTARYAEDQMVTDVVFPLIDTLCRPGFSDDERREMADKLKERITRYRLGVDE